MSEYEALNLMYMGFTFNALYTLGFILFKWHHLEWQEIFMKTQQQLCLDKVFTTVFCLLHAFFFVQSNMIGGGILQSYTSILTRNG